MFELDIDLSHYETTPAPWLVLKLSGLILSQMMVIGSLLTYFITK